MCRRVIKEMGWRKGQELKVGMQVDVLRDSKIRQMSLKGWTRGTVVFIGMPEDKTDLENPLENAD